MADLSLTLLDGTFAIHRLPSQTAVPAEVLASPFFAIMRTDEELSLVAPDTIPVDADRTEPGWVCLKVEAILDLSLVGILAELATVLATAQVSIFALSSFNTDYVLIRKEKVKTARQALETVGYRFTAA